MMYLVLTLRLPTMKLTDVWINMACSNPFSEAKQQNLLQMFSLFRVNEFNTLLCAAAALCYAIRSIVSIRAKAR